MTQGEELNMGPAINPEAEVQFIPTEYTYTLEEFNTPVPYEELYKHFGSPFVFQTATNRMAENAKKVGFKSFKATLKTFLDAMQNERRRLKAMVPNQTEFDGQAMELNCGVWESTDWGIYRDTAIGGRDYACAHPIMPVERLVNIDTGEVKIKLAYRRSGTDHKWCTTIVGKDVISTARTITSLATQGISVTSSTASTLVDYLNDMENMNYDIIPERKSIGRLGYIEGEGFSPFVDGLVFDGDTSFKHLYESIRSKGAETEWFKLALECRKMSVTARIMLAASFASPILSIVGALPFFVHLWGEASGTGKTVALMLAASVWGDPLKGKYMQTFNATQVGQERTAAFLNQLPFCIDELQLTKDRNGRSNFDVYQLAEGVGRARGKRSGGIEMTPTWDCCFLTTGESPLANVSAGSGAINRVIEIECVSGEQVIVDGKRISAGLKRNYGFAGEKFVEQLYKNETIHNQVKEIYDDFFAELCAGDSTEKQAMAAAAILTADLLATAWIFKDENELTAKDIRDFLASKEAVSAGRRAYDWLCDWVASNVNHFNTDESVAQGEVYGVLEGDMAYIIRGVFDRELQTAGFSTSATLSFLRAKRLIETRNGKGYTKTKRIGRTTPQCIWLRLNAENQDMAVDESDLLPL